MQIETVVGRILTAIGDRPVDRVAREAGLARETLRGILRGCRKGSVELDTIERIARVTGVNPEWIAWGVNRGC